MNAAEAPRIDPASALLAKLQERVDRWSADEPLNEDTLSRAIVVTARGLGMKILTMGTATHRPGVPLEWNVDLVGWSFDALEWMRREHPGTFRRLAAGEGMRRLAGVR